MTDPDLPTTAGRSRWEWASWLAGGAVVAVVLTWPLARRLRTSIPQDLGDPLSQSWLVAWGGHALRTSPLSPFHANAFWPAPTSYAHTDSLYGYAPAALFGEGPVAAISRYNLLFLFSYALAFAAAALLARELGCTHGGAAVAGMAFAWAPWKISHTGHLNVLSTGGVPLALFLLTSGYRRGRPWQVAAGWAVAAWQMSLGFALGIWFAYLLAAVAVVIGVRWLRSARQVDRSVATATAAGVAVFLGTTAFMVRPYLRIVEVDPGALRGPEEVLFFSPPLRSLLAAHPDSRAWGGITAGVRETVPWIGEQTLFPGLVAVVLAVVGLGWGRGNRPLRLWLAGATVVALLLSMGLRLWGGLLYEPLFEHAPGWQGMRTPGRLAFAWSLGIALLAALGADRVQAAVAAWRPGRFAERSAAAVAVVLAAVVAFEGSARMPLPAVPLPAAALRDAAPGPRLHLPSDGFNDSTYMLWSTEGFPRIANGSASYTPPFLLRLRQDAATFPDPASVQALRAAGLRSVVVHRDRIAGTPWESAADRPVEGLGIGRRDYGDVVVFDLDS